jgi:hypothetical protein
MNIKSFLNKLLNSFKKLFNKFPAQLKTAVNIGITVTENIKKFTDSSVVDVLTVIIPGNIDDKIKQILRVGLPVLLAELKLADSCLNKEDPQQVTTCAISFLNSLDKQIKDAFLHNLSVLVAQLTADGKLSWSDGVCIVEWYYQNKYKGIKSI